MWLCVRRYGAEGLPGDERVASPACWSEPRLSRSVPWVASSVDACPPINTLSWPCTGAFLWCRVDSRPGHAGPRRSKQKMLVTVAPRHGHARGACKVSIGGHGHAAVLMGAARRMMGTDRQHTKASVCFVVSARCCVTGLPLPQAPPAAPRALPAAPGPSRRQVRAQWAGAPWDRCTAGEASVWDDSGRDQVACPYEPYPHAGRCCQHVRVSPHALGCCACVAGALRRG